MDAPFLFSSSSLSCTEEVTNKDKCSAEEASQDPSALSPNRSLQWLPARACPTAAHCRSPSPEDGVEADVWDLDEELSSATSLSSSSSSPCIACGHHCLYCADVRVLPVRSLHYSAAALSSFRCKKSFRIALFKPCHRSFLERASRRSSFPSLQKFALPDCKLHAFTDRPC